MSFLHKPPPPKANPLFRFFTFSPVFLLSILLASSILLSCSHLFTFHDPQIKSVRVLTGKQLLITDSAEDEAFFCDRSHHRTDVCRMKGDVRVNGQLGSVLLYSPERKVGIVREEKVRPYTRKWEASVMQTIDEVSLRRVGNSTQGSIPRCDVQHSVPAVVFSTGGYTGNVYHEFNDGLIPLFISSQHMKGEVVFMILEYHEWWMTKYEEIVGQLTKHEVVDFNRDNRVHCFPEITVGLRIHDELAIDPNLTNPSLSMKDFQRLIHRGYASRLQGMVPESPSAEKNLNSNDSSDRNTNLQNKRPKLVILSRGSPRAILNELNITILAEITGFEVETLAPKPTTEMVDIYRILNACDVMVGVHGAAMTHLLYMRPGSTLIQVVPLGTDWAAFTYYGEPAMKLGLHYVEYKIMPEESSLSNRYALDDPVIRDPNSVNDKGWWETKKIYLESQDVTLSLGRFKKTLASAYRRAVKRSSRHPISPLGRRAR